MPRSLDDTPLGAEPAWRRATSGASDARFVPFVPDPVAPEFVGREVSCRVIGVFFDALAARGLPPEALIEGTDLPLALFQSARERMPWSAFQVVMRNAGRIWTDEELEEIGARVGDSPLLRAMFVVGRLLYSVSDFYVWVFGADGPAMGFFACEEGRAFVIEPGLLRLEVRMRPGYPPSDKNFVAAKGSMRGIARAFGYGPAEVTLEQDATGAVYFVRVPEGGGRLAWLRRSLTWLLAARRAGAELRAANEDLHQRYIELQREIEARNAAELARHELEADREELLSRLQLILDGMPLGCLLFDVHGHLDYTNPAAEGLFGSLAGSRGRRPYDLFPEGPARDEIEWVFDRLLAGQPVPAAVSDNLSRDGRIRRCEWHHTPLSRHDGTFAGILSVCEDVTERERTASQLLQAQKMDGIGRLGGGIAHDFNNLLSVVMGYASVLEDEFDGTPRARAAVSQIQRATERGAALASQLLAFSRRQVLEPRVLDLDEVVEATARMLRPLLGEDIEVRVGRSLDVDRVRADPTRIEQVLVNLAVNARDAMPHGGRLTFETRTVVLREGRTGPDVDLRPGPYVVLSVSDTGVGMDAETRARAFEPFYTTKPVGRGTGLGLSTVYGIVRQSGGHVTIRSEPGKGAAFDVYLPRVDAPVEADAERPRPAKAPGTEVILVVEDDEAVRKLTVEVLLGRGYRVLVGRSAAEGLRVLEAEPGVVDLLLTDLVMPGMNGVELARQVVAVRPGVRVLYMSGYAPEGLLEEGTLDDASDFVAKPFTPSALAAHVRALLDRPR